MKGRFIRRFHNFGCIHTDDRFILLMLKKGLTSMQSEAKEDGGVVRIKLPSAPFSSRFLHLVTGM